MVQTNHLAVFLTLFLPAALALPGTLSPALSNSGAATINSSLPDAQNVGNGNGTQFITGQCLSNADCASGCCAGIPGDGVAVCCGPDAAFAGDRTGCGFTAVSAAAPPGPTATLRVGGGSGAVVNETEPGAANVGKGAGSQFITGQCFSNADCASGCCAGLDGAGVCSGRGDAFQEGKTGCGFRVMG